MWLTSVSKRHGIQSFLLYNYNSTIRTVRTAWASVWDKTTCCGVTLWWFKTISKHVNTSLDWPVVIHISRISTSQQGTNLQVSNDALNPSPACLRRIVLKQKKCKQRPVLLSSELLYLANSSYVKNGPDKPFLLFRETLGWSVVGCLELISTVFVSRMRFVQFSLRNQVLALPALLVIWSFSSS